MTATATRPIATVEDYVRRNPATGRDVVVGKMVTNLPGGAPNAPLVILIPVEGIEQREIYTVQMGHPPQEFFRSWRIEKHFVGSPNFPKGLELGLICNHTDTGIGIPYEETSEFMCGQDGFERLRAYAYDETMLSMTQRRELSAAALRRSTKIDEPAVREQADDSELEDRIARAVAAGVAAEMARRDRETKKPAKEPKAD